MKSKVVEFTTEKLVACIALYAFILITLCVNLVSNSELFYRLRLLSMAAGAMVGLYICLKEGYKKPFIIGAILTAGWVSCMMVQPFSNYTASKMVYTLFFLFFSVILVYKLESLLVSRIIAILTMAVFILHMIRNDSMRDMLLDDSYNYISVLLLFALMSYFISCLHNDKKISIWVCIVFFVICIWAYGRGGILMSGTLVVLVLAANVISGAEKIAGEIREKASDIDVEELKAKKDAILMEGEIRKEKIAADLKNLKDSAELKAQVLRETAEAKKNA